MERVIEIKGNRGVVYKVFWKDMFGIPRARCLTQHSNGIKYEWGNFVTKKQATEYIKKYLIEEETEDIPQF